MPDIENRGGVSRLLARPERIEDRVCIEKYDLAHAFSLPARVYYLIPFSFRPFTSSLCSHHSRNDKLFALK